MNASWAQRGLCLILSVLVAAPAGFSQTPAAPAAVPAPLPAETLKILVLQGANAVNSISLLHSVPLVVEIHDQSDFPVEGATVVFTLPAQGPGGTFAIGGTSFSTRSDSHGQAAAPAVIPRTAGKFQISVTATIGNRKGEAEITQTNSLGAYSGAVMPARPWYKHRLTWVVAGAVVAGLVVAVVLTKGGSKSVVITPGPPVFQ